MSSVPAIQDSIINDEIRCIRCGYILRSLSIGAQCPECGLHVGLSLRPSNISYGNPLWVSRITFGAKLTAIGLAIPLLLMMLGLGINFLNIQFTAADWPVVAFLSMGLLSVVFICIGAVLFASPDLLPRPQSRHVILRRSVRTVVAISLLAISAARGMIILEFTDALSGDWVYILFAHEAVDNFAAFTAILATPFAISYGLLIASRTSKPSIRRFGKVVLWGYLIIGVAGTTVLIDKIGMFGLYHSLPDWFFEFVLWGNAAWKPVALVALLRLISVLKADLSTATSIWESRASTSAV